MAAPTIEEEQILVKFRYRVKDILETEEQRESRFLLRWLRARDLDLDQAETMLRASLAWRKENNIDSILRTLQDFSYFHREFPYYICGVDKKGQPVVVMPAGKCDLRKCVAAGMEEEAREYINYALEDVCHTMKIINKSRDPDLDPITQFTMIFDWNGFSYMQLSCLKGIQAILYIATTYEAHYPEILYSCLFINCPSFFNILLMMIKQVVAVKTIAKVSAYGNNREEWEKACREIIDDCQLEKIFEHLC